MGRLKDALHYQVWAHLASLPSKSTLLTCLASPTNGPGPLRHAWAELQGDAGRQEGMRKKTGLQAVLAERMDLFSFRTNERSHLLIELTPASASTRPNPEVRVDGSDAPSPPPLLMDQQPHYPPALPQVAAPQSLESLVVPPLFPQASVSVTVSDAAGNPLTLSSTETLDGGGIAATALANATVPIPVGMVEGSAPAMSTALALIGGPKQKAPANWKDPATGKGGFRPGHFQDLVWTPLLAAARVKEAKKDADMQRALVNAMEAQGCHGAIPLTRVGADFQVAKLKKDVLYRNLRLLDIFKKFEELFELEPDPNGGWCVRLSTEAYTLLAALPEGDVGFVGQVVNSQGILQPGALPERIENPMSTRDKMQALRIELLYALSRRNGRSQVSDLGQEPRVQKHKQGLHQAKKLLDFVKIFPDNFRVQSQMEIELASTDVSDREMIDVSILRAHQASLHTSSRGGPPSRFDQRGRYDDRSRNSYSQQSSYRGRSRSPRRDNYRSPPPAPPPIGAAPSWRDAATAALAHAQAVQAAHYAQIYGAMAAQQQVAAYPQAPPQYTGFHGPPGQSI